MIKNKRILVIDDDPGVSEAYQHILSSGRSDAVLFKGASLFEGLDLPQRSADNQCYELTFTGSGEEGIRAVKKSVKDKTPYAAAFVDMKMAGMSGAETTAWIWEIDKNIKIVIVTAYAQYLTEDITMVAGKNDLFYLRKPFNPEEIRQFARAFTNQWALEREKEMLTESLRIAHEKLEDMNKNLQKKVEEQTTMLIQSDKMASIGILAAGVAHEIKNPIAFLNSNLSSLKSYSKNILTVLKKYQEIEESIKNRKEDKISQLSEEIRNHWEKQKMDFIVNDIEKLIDDSLEGTERVSKIVRDLKNFSSTHQEDIEPVNLNEAIDTILNIIWNEIKYKTEIIKDYGDLPEVRCLVPKISHVFMNLLTNASQAIEEKGTVKIITRHIKKNGHKGGDEYIELKISDNGAGIPKENLTKIFDPFFTTKPVGEGTGLGLKIAYDIVKAHSGNIMVKSDKGEGTTFIIRIPLDTKL